MYHVYRQYQLLYMYWMLDKDLTPVNKYLNSFQIMKGSVKTYFIHDRTHKKGLGRAKKLCLV